jgi:hypothetical protein
MLFWHCLLFRDIVVCWLLVVLLLVAIFESDEIVFFLL